MKFTLQQLEKIYNTSCDQFSYRLNINLERFPSLKNVCEKLNNKELTITELVKDAKFDKKLRSLQYNCKKDISLILNMLEDTKPFIPHAPYKSLIKDVNIIQAKCFLVNKYEELQKQNKDNERITYKLTKAFPYYTNVEFNDNHHLTHINVVKDGIYASIVEDLAYTIGSTFRGRYGRGPHTTEQEELLFTKLLPYAYPLYSYYKQCKNFYNKIETLKIAEKEIKNTK